MSNDTRTPRQELGITKWKDNFGIGVLEWFPGFGKTSAGMKIAQRMSNIKNTPTLVIVHSNLMQQQWSDIIEELGIVGCEVLVIHKIVINQLYITNFRLIIFDEMHKYLMGPLFSTIFKLSKTIKFKLGLTGTLTKEHLEVLAELEFPVVDTVTIEEGKRNGWCSPIREFNLGVRLPDDEMAVYTGFYEQFCDYFAVFNNEWNDMFSCIKYEAFESGRTSYCGAYNYIVEKDIATGNEYVDRKKAWEMVRNANQGVKLNGEYRNLLYNTDVKLPIVKEIIERFNMKCITFGKSIANADKLERLIKGSIAIHSDIPTRRLPKNLLYRYNLADKPGEQLLKVSGDRQSLIYIKQFNEGVFHTAHSAKKIVEGLDIKGAQLMINHGFDSSKVTDGQKTGRINRYEWLDKGLQELILKIAYKINIYCIDTKEEDWLSSVQYRKQGIMEVESIDEIIIE